MATKVTINLDDQVLAFIDTFAHRQAATLKIKPNRSSFINAILSKYRQELLQQELAAAYQRDAEDTTYQEEVLAWDSVIGDGIDVL
ncbi:MAG TPA: CopG family transcriptional regulator [Cyanobacteria bacterium UBA11162]|nr:CopG family transcriptional regulator [Cyanobacteria bacterium UBA11162]